MRQLFRALIDRFRRHRAAAVVTERAPAPRVDRRVAAGLAETLDRAIDLGLWAHAERIAAMAVRLAPEDPGLTERLARLRLVRGEPEAALQTISACRSPRASIRLLRAVCLLKVARRTEAHLDLHHWSRRSAAPVAARRLLAHLEWEAGDAHSATAALMRNLVHLEDAGTLLLLLLLAVADGRHEQAERWARRLRRSADLSTLEPMVDVVIETTGVRCPRTADTSDEQVERLAVEITAAEPVIPALVEAQERQTDPRHARLLCNSIEHAYDELSDPGTACESLTRLWLRLDEPDRAADWARRGLTLRPMSAVLLRLLDEASDATPRQPARRRAA